MAEENGIIEGAEYKVDNEPVQEPEQRNLWQRFISNPWTKRIGKGVLVAGSVAVGFLIGANLPHAEPDENGMICDGTETYSD